MRHVFQCTLRWSDMDAFGHVNNVVFVRYLEEARIDLMFRLAEEAAAGSSSPGGSFRGGSVVARHEIDYRRPLVYRHTPVTIETWVTKVNAASATLDYEIKDTEEVYARARTVIVPYDLERARPRRLTDEEKSFLEGYFDDSAAPGLR
ncbi:acyl-CoA thioesterase [Streptomyces armeniacus]|uniref:Acyl-CoA thioesterase n=1 Tax=Streptomyces armeniacus TaxID=83291 RepID=A0A345XXJ9_9ACTN|nr:thioesterase family protein [Streptomyces armeniacus]AXK36365.1 acyl-CoA thioesterase [Streptomyces armeniacus]